MIRVKVGQENKISSAVSSAACSNWSQDTIQLYISKIHVLFNYISWHLLLWIFWHMAPHIHVHVHCTSRSLSKIGTNAEQLPCGLWLGILEWLLASLLHVNFHHSSHNVYTNENGNSYTWKYPITPNSRGCINTLIHVCYVHELLLGWFGCVSNPEVWGGTCLFVPACVSV